MTCKECGQVGKLTALMQYHNDTELSSLEETGSEFNRSKADMFAEGRIRPVCGLGSMCTRSFMWWWSKWVGVIPSRRSVLGKKRFWGWAAKLKRQAAEVHAVYEACGFGFTLQRQLAALGIHCYVVCPQKLDERNKRVKTDGLDAKALCLKLDRFVEG